MQGDDYILYCHPTKQKTPRSDHLREWYLRMLRVAQEEGVVTHLSNLYDTFFPGGRDHRIERPSVTQVPYFEGIPQHLCRCDMNMARPCGPNLRTCVGCAANTSVPGGDGM